MQATNSGSVGDRPLERRYRFSIAGLLLFVLAAGIGLAALRRPSSLAANAIYSLLLLSLGIAFIGMLYRSGPTQAFWTGFLAFGSLYAVMSLAPWFHQDLGHRLITMPLLDVLYPYIPPLPRSTNVAPGPWELWTGRPPDYDSAHYHVGIFTHTTDSFLVIGHSLFALLAAAGGGLLARHFYGHRTRDSADA
jgi:hypothetical protein